MNSTLCSTALLDLHYVKVRRVETDPVDAIKSLSIHVIVPLRFGDMH
jgi:hypothetical protein